MKRNFYLQHPLMAMHDPRMQLLFEQEGPRGTGTYWLIIEKLSMLPDLKAKPEYLRPCCKGRKLTMPYLMKIIREFQLFKLGEDDSFTPEELNPAPQKEENTPKKKEEYMTKNDKETLDSDAKNAGSDAENDGILQKMTRNKPKKTANKQDNALTISDIKEMINATIKENIKDIITAATAEKEKENTAATDDDVVAVDDATDIAIVGNPPIRPDSPAAHDGFGWSQPSLRPIRPWQELVDGLVEKTPWLEVTCMHSGYGALLMRHIKVAVDCFKEHIEIYDKWHDLLTESDARRYFANYTNPGQRTAQALHATLLVLDAKQKSAAPPDPYRYEQRIDGRRTYLGCTIPDNAPPRPDATAFWNEATRSWSSQMPHFVGANATAEQGKCHS